MSGEFPSTPPRVHRNSEVTVYRALSRDPEMYPDPEPFMPERFINSEGLLDVGLGDPAEYVFGFGRR